MLSEKVVLASEHDEFMKIELLDDDSLDQIGTNFNALVKALNETKVLIAEYQAQGKSTADLDEKIRTIENSINRITVLSDAGKKITASLNASEILENLFEFLSSVVEVNEMELYIKSGNTATILSINSDGKVHPNAASDISSKTSILEWSRVNSGEAVLNDAKADYTRYLETQISTRTGLIADSVMCTALIHQHKAIGALAVYSLKKDGFDTYHEEIIRSLSSFAAVAIDNSNVYKLLEENKEIIEFEKQKSDNLLLNILPVDVAQELKETGTSRAKMFENVSVLFSDFVSFTSISEKMSPEELVKELDTCFREFDAISVKYGLEKIKTIGDAYLVVSGLPVSSDDHAKIMVSAALEMVDFMKKREEAGNCKLFKVRIGINSGPVVAGIVGSTKFAYDIWGDTVNTAARMEQNSEPGRINISGPTFNLIGNNFKTTYRGKINAKNKGEIDMYFVNP